MFSADLVNRILDRSPIARLGQLDIEHKAQALPFVFARLDGELWSPIDGKPKRSAKLDRLAWIEAEPEVCVLIDHYEADWSKLWWLKLYCHADIHHADHPRFHQASAALEKKYPQYRDVAMFFGTPTMIRFEYRRWKSWASNAEAEVERQIG